MRTELAVSSPRFHCNEVLQEIHQVQSALEDFPGLEPGTASATQINAYLEDLLTPRKWERNVLISNLPNFSLPEANYRCHFLRVINDCNCGVKHKIFVHLCFENRQATGSHFLRFKLAQANRRQDSQQDFYLAVVADETTKRLLRLDGSAITYEFMKQAFEVHYNQILESEVNFLVLRPGFLG